jgi:hypothetical protein
MGLRFPGFLSVRTMANSCAWLMFCIAVCAASLGQTTSTDATSATPSEHGLRGVVVNSVSGEPLRRALVVASGATPHSMLTDAEGRFEFEGLPDLEVVVAARKPGFFNDLELHPETFQPQVARPGVTSSLVLKLMPESQVVGHIATVKGEPIEDAPVRIFHEHIVDGRKKLELRNQAITDEDGQFHLAGLTPGVYLLAAGPVLSGARTSPGRIGVVREEGFSTIFYPGVPELDGAELIVISGGQQVQADFALKPEPLFRVAGTAVGSAPGTGAQVQFINKAGENVAVPIDFNVATGEFSTRLPAGSYVLQIRETNTQGSLMSGDLSLVVNADLENLSVGLGLPPMLPVEVELHPTNSANEGADRGLRRQQLLAQVRLVSTEKHVQPLEFPAQTDERGALVVANFMPGRYSVEATPLPPWCVQSVTTGNVDLLQEDLVLGYGGRPEPIHIVLRDDCSGVRGKIHADGKPASGALVLIPDRASATHAQIGMASADVDYLFATLAPGDYRVLAFPAVEGLEFRNPEVLSPYLSKAVRVTLPPNEISNIDVERITLGKESQ